jgi:molybdopterin/thiamine biosynthesis adenylyltransferase
LLLGLKPLGLEIAKNLILSGLAKLTIVENDVISGH